MSIARELFITPEKFDKIRQTMARFQVTFQELDDQNPWRFNKLINLYRTIYAIAVCKMLNVEHHSQYLKIYKLKIRDGRSGVYLHTPGGYAIRSHRELGSYLVSIGAIEEENA